MTATSDTAAERELADGSARGPSASCGRAGTVRALVLGVLVLVAALAVWSLTDGPSGRYAEAVSTLPDSTVRASFTDWTSVEERIALAEAWRARAR